MIETKVRYYKKMFLSGAVFNWCAALLFFFTSYALPGDIPLALAGLVSVDFIYAILFFEYI